jgi:DNA (cytosine-5)-methyltransferase 1
MTHGSLFSGIGGFDLAAEWMGWENKFHCEWNPFGQKVLHHYFPNAEQFTDITKTDFTKYANKIDILTGGFPCQPYSSAGKRLGKEDDRHLFPEMLRAIREIQPRWVVGENVLGLVNWNGGLVFNEVQTDLETEGYEVQPYVLPAVSVNAPHRRDRVWFVAYSNNNDKRDNIRQFYGQSTRFSEKETATNTNSNGLNQCNSNNEINSSQGRVNALGHTNKSNGNGDVADTNSRGLEGSVEVGWNSEYAIGQDGITAQKGDASDTTHLRREDALENGELERERFRQSYQRNAWDSFPSVSPICDGNDGIPDRLDSITFPKWRNESIKAGGNAVVPQVVYQIFKAIEQYENLNEWTSQ